MHLNTPTSPPWRQCSWGSSSRNYKEAVRHEGESQAAAIIAANLGFSGGKEAEKAIRRLSQ